MPKSKNLTEVSVRNMKAPDSGRIEVRDALRPGLTLRVTAEGKKTFALVYRVAGQRRLRRLTLGAHPVMTLKQAREKAAKALIMAQEGVDPRHERDERRAREALTFEELVGDFVKRHCEPNLKNPEKPKRTLELHAVSRWGDRSAARITRRDVIELADRVTAKVGPGAGRETLKQVRRLFSWAVDREMLDVNPALGVKAPVRAQARERILSGDEIGDVWRAATEMGRFGDLVRLLLLTGARRNEIAGMRWEWLQDLDGDEPRLEIPAEAHKGKRGLIIPLSPTAVAIIGGVTRLDDGVYVLGCKNQQTPFSGISKAKRRLDRLSGVEEWWLHDLRRTVTSRLAAMGEDPFIIDRVLGHALPALRGVYDKHRYTPQVRDVLGRWDERLQVIVGEAGENVVPLETESHRPRQKKRTA